MSQKMKINPNIFIIQAKYYEEISNGLLSGAQEKLKENDIVPKIISVPGILELPTALHLVISSNNRIDGAIILGCAIKGETDHYEHVCRVSIDGVQKLSVEHNLPIGNGIITSPSKPLAIERSDPRNKNSGGKAAEACLNLINLKHHLNE